MNKRIFLFDMDGTLTEPRKEIELKMVRELRSLSKHGMVGIVTGSDIDYVFQQCKKMFEVGGIPADRVLLFPCNGTKKYEWVGSSFKKVSEVDMIETVSRETYNYILQTALSYQLMICVQHDLPFTGTFFHYRGSMVNWCPIGRQAEDEQRSAWVDLDKEKNIREYFLNQLKSTVEAKGFKVNVALGGSTSFDIYPEGWDKTYCLNHLGEYEETYFVGDKCQENGNDRELYEYLLMEDKAFETDGPQKTVEIIKTITKNII